MENKNNLPEVIIIGAGLCGMMMALYLVKRGYKVEIYEKAQDASTHCVASHRAIVLDLSARALLALTEIGLLKQVLQQAVPTENRIVLFQDNTQIKIPHTSDKQEYIYNIARVDLYKILLAATQVQPNIKINFSHQLVVADLEKRFLIFEKNNYETFILKKYSAVLGCDGANSILRQALNTAVNESKGYTHRYKEIYLPESFIEKYLCNKNMYKWVSNKSSILAHPKINQSFSGTLVLSNAVNHQFSDIFTANAFPQFQSIQTHLSEEFISQPYSQLRSVKVNCQTADSVLLLGDAAHGMLPFLGQGINCAFEDCRLFNNYLKMTQDNWGLALKKFTKTRQIDTNAIIEMSEMEYQEFEPLYSYKKQQFFIQLKLELDKRYSNLFKSYRYLLAFTDIPYAKIRLHHQFQLLLLNRIYAHFKINREVPWDIVDKWVSLNYESEKLYESY